MSSIFSGSWLVDVLVAVATMIALIHWYFSTLYDYWKIRAVPFIKPSFPFGNCKRVWSKEMSFFEMAQSIYNALEGERFGGVFKLTQPCLLIRDEKLIEKVLVTDFSSFSDRYFDSYESVMSHSLYASRGSRWKTIRATMNNSFTSAKLKGMFNQITKCGDNTVDYIENHYETEDLDIMPLTFRYANDITASCVFGISIADQSTQRSEFTRVINDILTFSNRKWLICGFGGLCPKLASLLKLRLVPRSVDQCFTSMIKAAIEYRKANQGRNDYLQMFLSLKEQEESCKSMGHGHSKMHSHDSVSSNTKGDTSNKVFTDSFIVSTLYSFTTFGSDYIACSINFILFELAKDLDVQKRLQEEVDSLMSKHGGCTFQAIKEMKYLDQVIQESLRLHFMSSYIGRRVTRRYQVPGSELILEPGLPVLIPVAALHLDPRHFPDPLKFDPDRFHGRNYKPGPTFMPFGDGPRICVVMQFAILVLKVNVAKIVSRFCCRLSPRTQLPLRLDPKSINAKPMDGIWISFQPRLPREGR